MPAHPTAPPASAATASTLPPSLSGPDPVPGLAAPPAAHLAPERQPVEEQSQPQSLSRSGPGHGANTLGPPPAAPVSPILARTPAPPPPPRSPNPEFAELLTPAKLRRRRRPNPRIVLPPSAGPSRDGWQTGDDVYRGAIADPTAPAPAPAPAVGPLGVEDDAVSLGSGSSSSSSSSSGSGSTWSIVSDLERGRRRTVAAIERFGERVGLRRGSESSSEHSVGSMLGRQQERARAREKEKERQGQGKRRMSIGVLSRSLTRRSSIDSTATSTAPRRQYIPRKRVFTLLAEGDTTTTPSLDNVLLRIQAIRGARGLDTPVPTRGGSAQGRKRPVMSRGATSFVPPPVPRPARTQSRLTTLRGVKPLTPSELMGLPSPASAPNLSALKEFPSTPIEERARTSFGSGSGSSSGYGSDGAAAVEGSKTGTGCWWLDVACPTWEDLRDIGELLALHPLTLEDVLQQDPREKMDAFDKLGYYFVAVRALDETYFKYTPGTTSVARIGKGAGKEDKDKDNDKDKEGEEDFDSPELSGRREGRRRGWGMGRAALVGKLAGREGRDKVEIVEDNPGREGLEGVGVGAVNVYLAVFADGIVTFHFDDISKHTARVRERIMAGATEYTSDSVAHGILDSIVDAFFPLVRYVDGEVDEIDSLTIDPTVNPRSRRTAAAAATPSCDAGGGSPEVLPVETDSQRTASSPPQTGVLPEPKSLDEKGSHSPSPTGPPAPRLSMRRLRSCLPTFALGTSTMRHRLGHDRDRSPGLISLNPFKNVSVPRHMWGLVYLRLFFLPITSAVRQYPRPLEPVFDRSVMLRRIVELRRIVTGMTRMLGAKGQVVARLRKTLGERGMGGVEAYVGDVEDHILLLQTSLYHYEYILAHCQPTYLSHLKYSYHITRRLISKHILILSTVAVSILPIQIVTSLFGMNVNVPQDGIGHKVYVNEDGSPAGYTWFGIIIAILFVIVCCMCALMRTWKWQARRKYAVRKGRDVPDWWDGFWGWK